MQNAYEEILHMPEQNMRKNERELLHKHVIL